jgi:hypothetical protein
MNVLEALEFFAGARAIFNDEVVHSDAFCTAKIRGDDRATQMIRVNPRGRGSEEQRWSFRSLFTFLNELSEDWGLIRNRIPGACRLKIYYADQDGKGERRLTVKVDEDWKITVQISRPDLVAWDEWELMTASIETLHGTRGRENKRARLRSMTYWVMLVRNMRGGNAWINHTAFVVIDAHEFHPIVLALADKLVASGLMERLSTRFIFALHASFGRVKPRHAVTEAAFCAAIPGYLHLNIRPQVPGEDFATVTRDGESYSILRGCYVSPWA